jgi:hypothetical protein
MRIVHEDCVEGEQGASVRIATAADIELAGRFPGWQYTTPV